MLAFGPLVFSGLLSARSFDCLLCLILGVPPNNFSVMESLMCLAPRTLNCGGR